MAIAQIPLDTEPLDSPWQPRESYDDGSLRDLAGRILDEDLIQYPVGRLVDAAGALVEADADGPGRLYRLLAEASADPERAGDVGAMLEAQHVRVQLACGHRRRRAVGLLHEAGDKPPAGSVFTLGYGSIPVDLRPLDDEHMIKLVYSENGERTDLNAVEEARFFLRLTTPVEEGGRGLTHGGVAALFGLKRPTVSNRISLLDLPDEVLQLVVDGELSFAQARAITPAWKLPDDVEPFVSKVSRYNWSREMIIERAKEGTPASRLAEGVKSFVSSVHREKANAERQQEVEAKRQKMAEKAKAKGEKGPLMLKDLKWDQHDRIRPSEPVGGCSEACACRAIALGHEGEEVPVCLNPKRRQQLKAAATKDKNKIRRDKVKAQRQELDELATAVSWDPAGLPRDLVAMLASMALANADADSLRRALRALGLVDLAEGVAHDGKVYPSTSWTEKNVAALSPLGADVALAVATLALAHHDLKNLAEYERASQDVVKRVRAVLKQLKKRGAAPAEHALIEPSPADVRDVCDALGLDGPSDVGEPWPAWALTAEQWAAKPQGETQFAEGLPPDLLAKGWVVQRDFFGPAKVLRLAVLNTGANHYATVEHVAPAGMPLAVVEARAAQARVEATFQEAYGKAPADVPRPPAQPHMVPCPRCGALPFEACVGLERGHHAERAERARQHDAKLDEPFDAEAFDARQAEVREQAEAIDDPNPVVESGAGFDFSTQAEAVPAS